MFRHLEDDKRALASEQDYLRALLRARESFDIKIAKQQRRIAALAALIEENEEIEAISVADPEGITDAVRTALKTATPRGLTAHGITVRLEQMCFPVKDYRNFRASLNNILKRLLDGGEIRKVQVVTSTPGQRGDQSVYEWIVKYGTLADLANPTSTYLQSVGVVKKKGKLSNAE